MCFYPRGFNIPKTVNHLLDYADLLKGNELSSELNLLAVPHACRVASGGCEKVRDTKETNPLVKEVKEDNSDEIMIEAIKNGQEKEKEETQHAAKGEGE